EARGEVEAPLAARASQSVRISGFRAGGCGARLGQCRITEASAWTLGRTCSRRTCRERARASPPRRPPALAPQQHRCGARERRSASCARSSLRRTRSGSAYLRLARATWSLRRAAGPSSGSAGSKRRWTPTSELVRDEAKGARDEEVGQGNECGQADE